jgi:hypothetical protein
MGRIEPPLECAHCGTGLRRTARACPECGADERTGWRESSIYDGLDLPEQESSGPSDAPRRPVSIFWILVGVGLLILLVLSAVVLRL